MVFSARSTRIGVLLAAAGLTLAACSGQHSTAPPGPVPLTAISLSVQPVACQSGKMTAEADTLGECAFQLGDMPVVQEGRADDVCLEFGSNHCPGTFDIDVFAPELNTWRRVERESELVGYNCMPYGWGINNRLVSGFGLGEFRDLLDTTGHLRLRMDQTRFLNAWVVAYARDYQFVTLPPMSVFEHAGIVLNGDTLWVSRMFADEAGEWLDSLFIIGLDGTREDAVSLNSLHIRSMCRTADGDVWVVAFAPAYTFALLGRDGSVRSSFTFSDPVRSHIAWWDDRIWFVTGEGGSHAIVGVNVAASVASGEAVIDRQFEADFGDAYFYGLFIEDGCLYGAPGGEGSIWRFSFEGEILEKWDFPVVSVEGMARDSMSLWVIHHGPSQARTNGILLTRFAFP